jgi:hypothetical protein
VHRHDEIEVEQQRPGQHSSTAGTMPPASATAITATKERERIGG